MPEAGLQLFLKNGKTIRKVPIMESKNSLKKFTEVHFNTSKIFLLYFYNAYDVNLREKNLVRSTAYSSRTNEFIRFHHFMKKE